MAEVCASGLGRMETDVGCDARLKSISENEKGGGGVRFTDSEEKTAGKRWKC